MPGQQPSVPPQKLEAGTVVLPAFLMPPHGHPQAQGPEVYSAFSSSRQQSSWYFSRRPAPMQVCLHMSKEQEDGWFGVNERLEVSLFCSSFQPA